MARMADIKGHMKIVIVVGRSPLRVGGYKIEEMFGRIMRPITEMGCKYGWGSQWSD